MVRSFCRVSSGRNRQGMGTRLRIWSESLQWVLSVGVTFHCVVPDFRWRGLDKSGLEYRSSKEEMVGGMALIGCFAHGGYAPGETI